MCTKLIVLNVISPVLEKQCVQHIFEGLRAQRRNDTNVELLREKKDFERGLHNSHIPPQCSFFTVTGVMLLLCCTYLLMCTLLHSVSASLLVVGTKSGEKGMQNLQSSRTVKV